MKPALVAIALSLALTAGPLRAGGGFDGIVHDVETTYAAKRLKIPFLGLANAFVKLTRPVGAAGFKLAVFEDLEIPEENESQFFDMVRNGAGKGWSPMVRVRSRNSGELTAIYTRCEGKRMDMLLATYEPGEATVIQLKVKPDTFSEWLRDPESISGRMSSDESY